MVKIRTNTSNEIQRIPGQAANPQFGNQALTKSIQQFSQTVSGIGMDILEEETTARDQNWSFERTIEDRTALEEQTRLDLQENGFEGHGQRIKDWAMKRASDSEKQAPSARARKFYESSTRSTILAGISSAAQTERVQRIEGQRKDILNFTDKIGEEIAVSGDPVKAKELVNKAVGWIKASEGTHFTKEESIALQDKAKNSGALRLSDAMIDSDPNRFITLAEASVTGKTGLPKIEKDQEVLEVDAGTAIKLMGYTPDELEKLKTPTGKIGIKLDKKTRQQIKSKGDDQVGSMIRDLTASQFQAKLRMARVKAKQNATKELSSIDSNIKDGVAAALNGEVEVASKQADLINKQIMNSSTIPAENKGRLVIQNEAGIRAFAEANRELQSLGIDDIDGFMQKGREIIDQKIEEATEKFGAVPPAYAASLKDQLKRQFQERATEYKRELSSDPMKVLTKNPEFQDKLAKADSPAERQAVLTDMMNQQLSLGVVKPRVTTLSQAKSFAADIQTAINGGREGAAQLFDQLQNEYGDLFPMVAKEIGQQKGAPPDLMLMAYIKGPEVVDNLVNRPNIKERFVKKGHSLKDVETGVRDGFPELERAFASRGGSGENDATVNGIMNQLETATMRFMNEDKTQSEAMDMAYDQIVAPSFHVSDVDRPGIGGPDSNLLIPREHEKGRPTNVKSIEAFMRSHHTGRGMMALGLDKFLIENGIDVDQQRISRMATDGEWVNDGLEGIVFVVPGEAFGMSGMVPVPGTRKKFSELSEGPFDRLTTDEMGETQPAGMGSRLIPDSQELRRSSGRN